jgi:hypothetical protein
MALEKVWGLMEQVMMGFLGSPFLIGNPQPFSENSYLAVTRLAVSMVPSGLLGILSFS